MLTGSEQMFITCGFEGICNIDDCVSRFRFTSVAVNDLFRPDGFTAVVGMDIEKDDELEEDPDQFLTANEIEQKRIEEERRKREEEKRNATTYKEWMAKERELKEKDPNINFFKLSLARTIDGATCFDKAEYFGKMREIFNYTSESYPDEIATKITVYKNTIGKRGMDTVESRVAEIRSKTSEYRKKWVVYK